ncbi:DUF2807 domain-containing protein [bacterium]|nr:DUF2807 domain-containing protein [bacterium]
MIRIIFLLTYVTFCLVSPAQNRLSQLRHVGTFKSIEAGKGINVTLIEGNREKVQVEIENGKLKDVITKVKKGTLIIKMKTKFYKGVAVRAFVTYRSLQSITAGVGSYVDNEGTLHAGELTLKAGSDASIVLDIKTKLLNATASAAKIEVVGSADYQEVNANTGARYVADQLISMNGTVKANTGASVWVNITDKLEAKANSGGDILYNGSPKELITETSLGGKISQNEE